MSEKTKALRATLTVHEARSDYERSYLTIYVGSEDFTTVCISHTKPGHQGDLEDAEKIAVAINSFEAMRDALLNIEANLMGEDCFEERRLSSLRYCKEALALAEKGAGE